MRRELSRRAFLENSAAAAAGLAMTPNVFPQDAGGGPPEPLFKISLAQWSLHRAFKSGKLDPLDFPRVAREDHGIDAIEYVNQFFMDKAKDVKWMGQLKQRADDHGLKSLLVMCDGEGELGDANQAKRQSAIENHFKWVEAAKFLGCHSIRVNAGSSGTPDEQRTLATDGLRRLTDFAARHDINVLVENHGGLSSNGAWLASVIKTVDHPRCGTLPDFGNFLIGRKRDGAEEWYDRYQGVAELMPYAKAVSAKSHDFDAQGNETRTKFENMMRIVLDAGYRGHVGIEYEGDRLSEPEGIKATKRLLEKVREQLAVDPMYRRSPKG
jgi:L-ribulose-5-phosphate 3-epimerase